ncbi:hypothetical protein BKA70DRAFT_35259 [Coprinopsis sp. MPI-PUGE-AT-0042]|nr:hypothetical protein BKA70DRAFT_35259 [Coprinopsis sp. MPI-PUGE-AT-0042]
MLSSRIGKLPLLVLSLCLATLPQALAARTASACQGRRAKEPTFCVNATIENDIMTYQLTNLVEPEDQIGWMAIGYGTTMLNSDMIILWKNDDGSQTVSQRKAVWYMEPLVLKMPKRIAEPVQPKLTAWHPEKSTTYAFQIPVNKTRLARSSKEDLIFAYSPVRPESDSPHAMMARHKEAGYITLEFSEEEKEEKHETPAASHPADKVPSSSHKEGGHKDSSTHTTVVLLHAFFLSFAFLGLLPTGVITARWARTFTPVWFKVHWIVNYPLAMPLVLLGWVLGPIAVNQHRSGHFNDKHKIWGTIIVSVYLVQVLLGRHIHQWRLAQALPLKRVHPPLNIVHAVVGCLTLVFAFLQVRSGLEKLTYVPGYYDSANWGIKLWNFWVVAVPFIYVVGLYLIPKQFAQDRELMKAQEGEGYAPVPDDEGARLLAERNVEEIDLEEKMSRRAR